MKATFECTKHNLPLLGHPLWDLMQAEPDVYTVSFRDMHCPEDTSSTLIKKCSESNWEVIVE